MDFVSEIELLDTRLLSGITTVFPAPLTDHEKISVNAFLVLGHACIEEHIEESFLSHANELARLLVASTLPADAARAALAFGLQATERLKKLHPYDTRDWSLFVTAAVAGYDGSTVQQNHGVKTRNVKKLAEGVGLPWPEFDAKLTSHLADLNNLGSRRGEAGHLAPLTMKATKITNRVDPDDVRRWVRAGRDAALAIRRELSDRIDGQMDLGRRVRTGPRRFRA